MPKDICQVVKFDITYVFLGDPNITENKITRNTETIERLEGLITSESLCSIVSDIHVYDTSNVKTIDGIKFEYTEIIEIRVSANENITITADRVTDLKLCLGDVIKTASDVSFKDTLKLNVSGVFVTGLGRFVSGEQKSCCHVIYGLPQSTDRCCKPGFIEDGDNCGE